MTTRTFLCKAKEGVPANVNALLFIIRVRTVANPNRLYTYAKAPSDY